MYPYQSNDQCLISVNTFKTKALHVFNVTQFFILVTEGSRRVEEIND